MSGKNENELKQDNQSFEDRCKEVEGNILRNINKHELYQVIDYEELQNFNFVQSDEENYKVEFSTINPNFLDLDLEDSDSKSNAPAVSIIEKLLLPNEQYNEICSQLNEGQQHLFNFIMQYALHCKLVKNNNMLPPKSFQIFLSEGAGILNCIFYLFDVLFPLVGFSQL